MGERSRPQRTGARMLGGSLASSSGDCCWQSATGLPVWLKLSLMSAWSLARWRYGGQLENTPMISANKA